jgi:hypothetical protein
MAKRGRKSKKQPYFGPNEEQAVVNFLNSTDEKERNEIYNQWLKAPLNKMIESIIRRYSLYRKGISFEELHADTLSHLMTKAHKFEEAKGTKAYSYYGTICRNYLLQLLIKDEKHKKQITTFEDVYMTFDNRTDLSYDIDEEINPINDLINSILKEIRDTLDEGEFTDNIFEKKRSPEKKKLTENERRVGEILVEILTNWEIMFNEMEGAKKFNKLSILSTIREGANLSTKDVRTAMKRYKKLYELLKGGMIDEGLL